MADSSRLGRYEIRREIARSNDIVYEAMDLMLGRRVALKELLLPPNLTGLARRERVERFYREARAAGALSHRNIVTIYEIGEDHDRHYIAMEFLEGQTLRRVLDLQGAMPIHQAVDILTQTLDGLGYAHGCGVVHRDVKPDNLYLLPDGTLKLTDFGIARIMEEPSMTGEGQVFGTPSYMSPEQIAGKPVDERTDLFSTGVMAYEIFSGAKPFVGDNLVALTYQILNVDPIPPRGLPEGIVAFLRRAMARSPVERFQTAGAMAAALRDASIGRVLPALPVDPATAIGPTLSAASNSGPPTIPPRSRRMRVRLGDELRQFLIAIAAGLLLGSIVVGLTLGVRNAYEKYSSQVRENAAMAVYQEGASLYRSKRYGDAIRSFEVVLKRAGGTPLAADARDAIVKCHLQLGDNAMGWDLQRAEEEYVAATRADPNSAESYLDLADVLERLNHFDEAIAAWNRAIALDGFGEIGMEARRQESIAYYNRGVSEANVGHRDNARVLLQDAIDAYPEGPIAARAQVALGALSPPAFSSP